MVTVTVRLSDEVNNFLLQLAHKTERKRAFFIKKAIEKYIWETKQEEFEAFRERKIA